MTTTAIETTTDQKKPDRITLFQINDAILAVVDRFEDEEGGEVDPEEIARQLNQLEGLLEEKGAGCIMYVRGQEVLAAGLAEEARRLNARAAVHTNRAKRMKEALRYVLEAQHRTKLETTRGTIAVQRNGGLPPLILAPDITDPAHLPERFQRVKVEPNNEAIRAALEAGELPEMTRSDGSTFPIAVIGEPGKHVRIR